MSHTSNLTRIIIGKEIRVVSASKVDVSPKAKKARAILALVALSKTGVVSRQDVADMLWSNIDRAKRLARLRDVLHHMQKGFAESVGKIFLVLKGNEISLQKTIVSVEIEIETESDPTAPFPAEDFLSALEGIDPVFDRWIKYTREVSRKSGVDELSISGVPEGAKRYRRSGLIGPSVIIAEFNGPSGIFDEGFVPLFIGELASALSRMRWFGVIVKSNSSLLQTEIVDGSFAVARYALVGHFQINNDELRLSIILTDLKAGGMIVWAANFSHAHKSALDTSMALANLAAASLDAELLLIEAKQDQNDIFPKTETYAVVLQSIPAIFRLEREGFLSAGHRLERAVAMDRESSLAHSWFALWHLFLVGQGWAQQPYQSLTQAGQAARRAMLIDPKDARAVAIAGHVKAYLGKKLREALALHEHAIELNPALPLAWHFAGVAQAYVGNHDVAYRQISRCLELAPSDPHGFFAEGAMCIVHFLRRDYEAAVALGRRVTARHPHFRSVHVAFLAALGQAGYTGEATYVRERLLAIDAHFSLRRFRLSAPFQRPADLEHFVSGLRLGGIV